MRAWHLAAVLMMVTGSMFAHLPGVAAEGPGDPRPTWTSEMWGGLTPQGWGLTQLTITNPGPTITVAPGERVDLTLNSVDVAHRWHLDYNGNDFSDGTEPESGVFTPSPGGVAFGFNAISTPGTYWYRCSIHGWDFQRGLFIIVGNAPPTVAIAQPPGTPPQTWSGGSTHTIQWSMMDPNDPITQLSVWVNYSYNAGANGGPIAGPLLGGVMSVPWTVPLIDATDVQVTVDVLDPAGAKATDTNAVPNVDSTRPAVTSTVPASGASGVATTTSIEVTFSEAMNQPSAQGSVSLCRMPGCIAAPLNVAGWTGNTLRMQPVSVLTADADYQATVSTAARDASDPGNGLLPAHVWTFRTANTPPVASVGQPGAGSRWTGGSAHDVLWTATDAEDPPSALSVWVNYSTTGAAPWTAIAGPMPGDTGSTPWTVPTVDVATARINVTAADLGGVRTSALSASFSIDSTPPTVSATNPANGAPSVPVNANAFITFSEPMSAGVTGTASVVGLRPVAGGAWIPLTFMWDPSDTILTANPVADLATMTSYRLFVNGSAQDASDPGLAMGTGVTADFTTSAVADTAPPQIADVAADPATQTVGGVVEVSANVTDDVAVSVVAVNVTLPDASTVNQTMALGAGSRYAFSGPWTQVGAHAFVVWASDTSGNWASAIGSFATTAADTTPPVIAHTQPAGPHYVGAEIRIRVTVTDAGGLAQVRIDYVDSAGAPGNVSMALEAGDVYWVALTPTAPGTVRYHFYAADDAGNVAVSQEYSLTIETRPPATEYTLVYVAIVVVLAVLAIAYLLWRRRRKGADEAGPKETS